MQTNYRKGLMSIVKKKSQENLDSAKILIENKKYNSSVHCSYYACFQMSKYCLNKNNVKSYDEQEKETQQCDSHLYIITQVRQFLFLHQNSQQRKTDDIDYQQNIESIKRSRKKSDYNAKKIIDKTEACEALNKAKCIEQILNFY